MSSLSYRSACARARTLSSMASRYGSAPLPTWASANRVRIYAHSRRAPHEEESSEGPGEGLRVVGKPALTVAAAP